MSEVDEPKFDPQGKYLYFFASTDAGPVLNWFDQSSIDMRQTESIYLVTLQKETISPFAKENDEEKVALIPVRLRAIRAERTKAPVRRQVKKGG